MLEMQSRMNARVHEQWIDQDFEWYRAVWIECGELMDHVGYKWWKKQVADMEQVRLEVIDIWHFGMSALFGADTDLDALATQIAAELAQSQGSEDIRSATEALAQHALESRAVAVPGVANVMQACERAADALYQHYVGKNVLNFFRQDHGYQDGTYIKQWQDREDNEHLSELLQTLDHTAATFPDALYQALLARYKALT